MKTHYRPSSVAPGSERVVLGVAGFGIARRARGDRVDEVVVDVVSGRLRIDVVVFGWVRVHGVEIVGETPMQ